MWLLVVPILPAVLVIISNDPSTAETVLATFPGISENLSLFIFGVINWVIGGAIGLWVTLCLINYILRIKNGVKEPSEQVSEKSTQQFLPFVWISILKTLVVISPILLILPGFLLTVFNLGYWTSSVVAAIGYSLTFIGVIAALIYIVYFTVKFYFPGFRLVTHDTRGVDALKESSALVKGKFWSTTIRLVVPKIVFIIPILVLEMLLSLGLSLAFAPIISTGFGGILFFAKLQTIINIFLSAGVTALFLPLIILADYAVYEDLDKS